MKKPVKSLRKKKESPDAHLNELSLKDLPAIHKHTAMTIANSEAILRLFPDITLSKTILTNLIMSPLGKWDGLIYKLNDDTKLPTHLKGGVLSTVKRYVNNNYELNDKVKRIITETLFTRGSYVELVIPANATSELVISHTAEDYSQSTSMGFKYPSKAISMGLEFDANIDDLNTDNIDDIIAATTTNVGTESYNEQSKLENTARLNLLGLTPTEDELPIVMKADTRSVIPIINKNDIEEHLGYFIMVDETGSPVYDDGADISINDNIKKLYSTLIGGDKLKHSDGKTPTLTDTFKLYSTLVDNEISKTIAESNYKRLGFVKDDGWVKNTLFKRSLSDLKTKLILLGRDNVQYYANAYKENGIGESLLEKVMVTISLRAMLTFAKVNGEIKQNVPLRNFEVTLDDNDPNPKNTMKIAEEAILRGTADTMPIGTLSATELTSWLHKAGVSINFKHKDLPDMSVNLDVGEATIPEGSQDLLDELKNTTIKGFGIPPVLVEDADNVNFATTIVSSNALLTESIKDYQQSFNKLFKEHIIKYIKNDVGFQNEIKESISGDLNTVKRLFTKDQKALVKKEKINDDVLVEEIYNYVISLINVTLPPVSYSEETTTKGAYDSYSSQLDDVIEHFFSEEAMPEEFTGELTEKIEDIQTTIKSTLLRKWMLENNYIPDLQSMLSVNIEGKPEIELASEYNEYLTKIGVQLKSFFGDNMKLRKKTDKIVEKLDNGDGEKLDDGSEEVDNDNGEVDNSDGEVDNGDGEKLDDGSEEVEKEVEKEI